MSRCEVRAPIAGNPQCKLEEGHEGAHDLEAIVAKGDDSQMFACPFCGKTCMPAVASNHPAIMHQMPFCEQFDKAEDALDFAKMCHAELERLSKC